MGYISDVAYVIHFDTVENRDNFITLLHAKNETHTNAALSEVEYKYSAHPIITFYQKGRKWYESYPEVQAHHALMRDAEKLFGAEWRFVRVGEDNDDLQIESGGDGNYELWEYVDPVRSIRVDFPAPDAE